MPRRRGASLLALALALGHVVVGVPPELKQAGGGGGGGKAAWKRGAASPLAEAAAKGDTPALASLLASGDHAVDHPSGFGMTPLHLAAGRDRGEAVALLLAHGAAREATDARGWTALHLAASRGAAQAAAALLQAGADVVLKDRDGHRAAALAAQGGHSELARTLADAEGAALQASEPPPPPPPPLELEQLPAASVAAAAARSGSPPPPAPRPKRPQPAPVKRERTAADLAKDALLRRFAPRGAGDAAPSGPAGQRGPGAPALLLPHLPASPHHEMQYHAGADGEVGVAALPTEHAATLTGRAPSPLEVTRDKVAGWFESGEAKETAAKAAALAAEVGEARASAREQEGGGQGEDDQEELARRVVNLHTRPRVSNDTAVRRAHHHVELKPEHAPVRHAEIVAAAMEAQAGDGGGVARGMAHPALRKHLGPGSTSREGARVLGQDESATGDASARSDRLEKHRAREERRGQRLKAKAGRLLAAHGLTDDPELAVALQELAQKTEL